jgi:hypothetical protein
VSAPFLYAGNIEPSPATLPLFLRICVVHVKRRVTGWRLPTSIARSDPWTVDSRAIDVDQLLVGQHDFVHSNSRSSFRWSDMSESDRRRAITEGKSSRSGRKK